MPQCSSKEFYVAGWVYVRAWPPERDRVELALPEKQVEIRVDAEGAVRMVFLHPDTAGEVIQFRPVHFTREGYVFMEFGCENGQALFSCDFQDVPLRDFSADSVFLVTPSDSVVVPQMRPLYETICIDHGDPEERFFLSTIKDLDERTAAGSSYDLTRAAGLLRQLLTDNPPLLTAVNRKHQIQLRFEVVDPYGEPPVDVVIHKRQLNPEFSPRAEPLQLNLDRFLAAPVISYGGQAATVRDVIRMGAHVKGGVHRGVPREAAEHDLHAVDNTLRMGLVEATGAATRDLCRITLNALRPLVEAVLNQGTQN